MKLSSLCFLLCYPFFLGAYCTYPVTTRGSQVYYVTVGSHQVIELNRLNIETGEREAVASSYCNPYMVRLMPDGKAVSFIDDGLLKIRHTNRRSEKTIALDLPLYDYNQVLWQTDEYAVVSARLGYHYGIFKLFINGSIEPLIHNNEVDYIFPYIVENKLYYIENIDQKSSLMCFNIDSKENNLLMNSDSLLMYPYVNEEGDCFVLKQVSLESVGVFSCYNVFRKSELFRFSIALELMEDGMVQDMMALCPLYYSDYIYYVHCDSENEYMSVYRYDVKSQESICCISKGSAHKHCIGLLDVNGVVWYGGTHNVFT